jgi:uncharacterized protein YuzB (UPF0349 family)
LTTNDSEFEGIEAFDAATVIGETVRFGPNKAAPVHYALEDVDKDGDIDMILQFKTRDAGIAQEDIEAVLNGSTVDGQYFYGKDLVRIVPPKSK